MKYPNSTQLVSNIRRRTLLKAMSGLAVVPIVGCGGGSSAPEVITVKTASGVVKGEATGHTIVFRGIRYAQAPVGPLRFQSPKPYVSPAAEISANAFGPASIQTLPPYVTWIYPIPSVQSEDCLTVNVWRPTESSGSAPVIVWFHGGAWRTGATDMPLMDGRKLAEMGFVVVTANFRLGTLGYLTHPDFTDPETGISANWGLQDQAAALAWVRDNVSSFGGDPNNVCLIGQSAGAINAALIVQHPTWRKLVHKVVLMSPASISHPRAFNLADAVSYTELLAKSLGTTPKGLYAVKAEDLHRAELALNSRPLPSRFTSGAVSKAAPVQDGKTVFGDWEKTDWPATTPVIITNTLTEGSFFFDLYDQLNSKQLTAPLPTSLDELRPMVIGLVGSSVDVNQIIDTYTLAAQEEGRSTAPGDIWVEIYGDGLLRYFGVRYAERLAKQGNDVRYGTFMHSVLPPGKGVPHCADVPFLFGTYSLDYYRAKIGASSVEDKVSEHLMTAIASFAGKSDVQFANGLRWPRLRSVDNSSALIAPGNTTDVSIGAIPKKAQLAALDPFMR